MAPSDLPLLTQIATHRAPNLRLPAINLQTWKYRIRSITLSGSHAKNTALSDSDLDFFLDVATSDPIQTVQQSLATHLHAQIRNVAVRALINYRFIDLTPAVNNVLWQYRYETTLRTNVAEQIRYVQYSGLTNEILLAKLWRRRHALRFPSYLLELAVIHALRPGRPISHQFRAFLDFLATDFPTTTLPDPANSLNVVSDLLTPLEKYRISTAASFSITTGQT